MSDYDNHHTTSKGEDDDKKGESEECVVAQQSSIKDEEIEYNQAEVAPDKPLSSMEPQGDRRTPDGRANVGQKKENDRLERITALTAKFGQQEYEVHRSLFQQLSFPADQEPKGNTEALYSGED